MAKTHIYDPSSAGRAARVEFLGNAIYRGARESTRNICTCLEMGDDAEVMRAILRRGLKSDKFYAALKSSRLVTLSYWLELHPEFAEPYHARAAEIESARSQRAA